MRVTLSRRVQGIAIAVLAVAGLIGAAAPASAAPPVHRDGYGTVAPGRTYLALGDSVPFGYRGGAGAAYSDADNFVGFPELVADDLHLRDLNASCPGETTDSFLDATAQSNGCENSLGSEFGYRDFYPLHVQYSGSQLDYAVETLQDAPKVRLVTLMLGANDGFLCQRTHQCDTLAGLEALAAHVGQNLNTILSTLRTEGGYSGPIVVVNYYALDYGDPVGLFSTQALNTAIAGAALANGAVVADAFAAFGAVANGGSSIAAGLVLPGDVHPTLEGQRVLAQAVEAAIAR